MELRVIHERCSGCGTCRLTCALENFREVNPAKALLRIRGRFPAPGDYRIDLCDQCGECAEICPVEAITQLNGAYRVDTEACINCMVCVDACPKGVVMTPHQDEEPAICTACGACAAICPREAIITAPSHTLQKEAG
ncbi:MAG: 4Fe-4S binding protein [Desulfosarcinaceae bacterium]|nr:4Fe-4S binding protein [Desulfosarcinaceae bacterium]